MKKISTSVTYVKQSLKVFMIKKQKSVANVNGKNMEKNKQTKSYKYKKL